MHARAAACAVATVHGGEACWSSLDFELPAIGWDVAGLYAELGRRRTQLEDQGGGSGDHNNTTSSEAARPSLVSTCGKEIRGAPGLERRSSSSPCCDAPVPQEGDGEAAVAEIEVAAAAGSGIGRSSMLCPGERRRL
jgi:hypothetical protein